MDSIYDLVSAIQKTEGRQCAAWKGELRGKLMDVIHSYADACAANPFSSKEVSGQQVTVEETLQLVFVLIPETKEKQG